MDGGTVGLFTLDTLDVADELSSVTFQNLAGLLSLVVTAGDHDLVILSDWDGADVVLLAQLLAQWGAHDLSADVRWSGEMSLTILSS